MKWNYRVLRHTDGGVDSNEEYFMVHEVYYEDDGKPSICTSNECKPFGNTLEELKSDMEMMVDAFEKPVLDYSDFP